jgi:autotransporter-associated beta strand protein
LAAFLILKLRMNKLLKSIGMLLGLVVACADRAWAVDDVAGDLFTLTHTATAPNGAWSWFQDERAIVDASDPDNPRLLVSSVSSAANGDAESGDVDLLWINLSTGQQGEFELSNRLERDDHDSASLYLRPDGRYLAMYSRHISDSLTRWRISTNPHDPTSWGAEQTLTSNAGTTYNNVYYLPDDAGGAGRTYDFTRATNFDPVVLVSDDDGSNWSAAGKLLTQGGSGDRPYLRYASDGKKIHFLATEEHPRDFLNSVYHGYVQDGVLYDSKGNTIDANLFDSTGVSPTELTPVFKNGSEFDGTTMNRAWTINLEVDNTGNPVGILSARANDSNGDHRFFYARYNGADWQVNQLAKAGGFLYAAEDDYTGLASIDPENPNVVYMSSDVDPRDESNTSHYELYKGVTSDFGKTWSWSPITENSTIDNLRPVVPNWDGARTAVAWMRGAYTTYTNWNTEIVGLALDATDAKSLLWRGSADGPNQWNGGEPWDSGAGAMAGFQAGDEAAFDDSALSFQVEIPSHVVPSGVAFNNSAQAYTVTGAGIGGNGMLRVIGGGSVTLDGGSHDYTGDTLIAHGTLALAGEASLAATPHILVKQNGVFDVSTVDAGLYNLSNQTLTIEGTVLGDVYATNGSSVELLAANSVEGNLTLTQSIASGAGGITGNLSLEAGAVVQVGGLGFDLTPVVSRVTYVDATSGGSGNTALAAGGVFSPPANGDFGADQHWELRSPFASHGTIFESGGEAAEDAEQLVTTITGLNPGSSYEVFVAFWDAGGAPEDWSIRAGFDPQNLTLLANGVASDAAELGATGAGLASDLDYLIAPTLFTEQNRTMFAGLVGTAVANEQGELSVLIDDLPSTIGANNRTWYDGLGFLEVGFPAEQIIAMHVGGDYSQSADSTLQLDVFSPGILDRLEVSGHLAAAGILEVNLAEGAPLPQLGDKFELFDFGSSSGDFDVFNLPALDAGLAWNVSKLLTTGELEVTVDVDLDDDGDVDGRDYLLILRTDVSLIHDWELQFGQKLITPAPSNSSVEVPEPATAGPLCLSVALGWLMRSWAVATTDDTPTRPSR